MADEFLSALRTAYVPNSEDARQRAVAAAREAYRVRPAPDTRSRATGRVATAMLVGGLAFCFTAPGHAATGWVGRLVGIGEVGGPPSVDQPVGQASGSTAPTGPKVVIANGSAPDGSRYELVVFQSAQEGTCLEVEFPRQGNGVRAPGQCTADQPLEALNGFGFTQYSPNNGDNSPTAIPISGIVSTDVARVRVNYESSGSDQGIEASVAKLTRPLQEQIGAPRPLAAFIAFLPIGSAGDGTAQPPPSVSVTAYDTNGQELAHAGPGPGAADRSRPNPPPVKASDVRVEREAPGSASCPGTHVCFRVTLSPTLRSNPRVNYTQVQAIVLRKRCELITTQEAKRDPFCHGR